MARSSSASDPKSKAQRLARATDALVANPADVAALARVAAAIEDLGNKSLAARAFEALTAAAREDGQLALAAYAAASLGKLGDARGARAAIGELARAYAKDSPRVDAKKKAAPPAPPRKAAAGAGDKGGAAANDAQAAMKAASEAIAKAAAAAAERSKAGKAASLPYVPLVGALEAEALQRLLELMEPVARRPGEVVVDVGQDARSLFLVARGALEVARDGELVGRLGAGAFFGEIALLSGARRTAKVAVGADEPAWLLEVPRDAIEAAAAKAPALADVLARHARARLLANTMRGSEIFKRLAPADRETLMPRFTAGVFAPGSKVLRAGEEAERLHVVVSGDVEVRQAGKVLAQLGPGDVFGEMSLLGRRPAVADVVARTRTATLSLDRAGFDDIAVKHPEVLADVYKLLVAREAKNRAFETTVEVTAEDIVT